MDENRDLWLQMFLNMYAPVRSEYLELLLEQYKRVLVEFEWDVLEEVMERYLLSDGVETHDNFAPLPPKLSTMCRKVERQIEERKALLHDQARKRALPPPPPEEHIKRSPEELARVKEYVKKQLDRLKF